MRNFLKCSNGEVEYFQGPKSGRRNGVHRVHEGESTFLRCANGARKNDHPFPVNDYLLNWKCPLKWRLYEYKNESNIQTAMKSVKRYIKVWSLFN